MGNRATRCFEKDKDPPAAGPPAKPPVPKAGFRVQDLDDVEELFTAVFSLVDGAVQSEAVSNIAGQQIQGTMGHAMADGAVQSEAVSNIAGPQIQGTMGLAMAIFQKAMTSLNEDMRALRTDQEMPADLLREMAELAKRFQAIRQHAVLGCVKLQSFASSMHSEHLDNLYENLENGWEDAAKRTIEEIIREVQRQKQIFDWILDEHKRIAQDGEELKHQCMMNRNETMAAIQQAELECKSSGKMMKGYVSGAAVAACMAFPLTGIACLAASGIAYGSAEMAKLRKEVQMKYGPKVEQFAQTLEKVTGAIHAQSMHLEKVVANLEALKNNSQAIKRIVAMWDSSEKVKRELRKRIDTAKPQWQQLESAADAYLKQDRELSRTAAIQLTGKLSLAHGSRKALT